MAVEKIRQSLDLEVIFHNTTSEVRELIDADRVAIYRFNDDWSGRFVSESDNMNPTAKSGVESQPLTFPIFDENRGLHHVRLNTYHTCGSG